MAGDIDKAMMNAECYKLKDTSFKLQEGTGRKGRVPIAPPSGLHAFR